MKIFSMPMSIKWSRAKVIRGFWKMGMSGFGNSSVKGRNRVPNPAPRTNACLIAAMELKIPNGGRNSLARQRFAVEELRLLCSANSRCAGDRRRVPCPSSELRGPEFQSVHFTAPRRANLYRRQALSPNEMHRLRNHDGAVENDGRNSEQSDRNARVLPDQRY